jgi:putative transport protein
MEFLRNLLEHQPMVALFATIALGYLLGEVNFKGLSLGAGAVLFVALALGWFAPKSVPPAMVGTFGLALFLYAVGIQYGTQFFRGLASAEGRRANLIAVLGVLLSISVALLFARGNVKLGYALGMFAGSGTCTAALQAAIETLRSTDPAVGYSVAYPFGVAGPILVIYLGLMLLKPRIDSSASGQLETIEIAITHPAVIGRRLDQVTAGLPAGVQVVALREHGHNCLPAADLVLAEGDVLALVGPARDVLEQVRAQLGERATGRIADDRHDLDYLRVFASRPALVGCRLGDLAMPEGVTCSIAHVRRGDTDIVGRPDLVLEYGDSVGLLASRAHFAALRKFFGNSIKGTADFSYISIGLGLALGFLVGAIHIPLPGMAPLALGLAGVLIVALVLGKVRRTGPICWTMPVSANAVLRNLGLTLFIAQVGMSSGPKFVATVAQTGFQFLGIGALVLLACVLPILLLGMFVYRMPYDQVAGIIAGAIGNPAILAFANRLLPTERPDIAYAMIFPGTTILKILIVDLVPAFFGT